MNRGLIAIVILLIGGVGGADKTEAVHIQHFLVEDLSGFRSVKGKVADGVNISAYIQDYLVGIL